MLAGVVLLLIAATTAGGGFFYYKNLESGLRRADMFGGARDGRPARGADGAQNILLLGNDSRDSDDPNHTPEPGDSHTDTIVLMHIDAGNKKAYLISVPRDLYVYVPRSPAHPEFGDTSAKINAAFAWGGVPLAVQAVEDYSGVRIDHVVMVDFEGFKKVTDVLGGVDLENDQEFTSINEPKFRHFKKGLIHLDGAAALDYVRQRQQFADGDFTRMRHQQMYLRALLDKATTTDTLANPRRLNAFLRSVTKTLTVDHDFSLTGAALRLRNLRGTDLTFLVSPNLGPAMVGEESVMMPDKARARALFEAVAKDRVGEWLIRDAASDRSGEDAPDAEADPDASVDPDGSVDPDAWAAGTDYE
ncbi:LytR family transcriptional regulator [Planosporangium mesophilum]|nr:LytR family transcriptional regulator [Planosporangium mesophilum]